MSQRRIIYQDWLVELGGALRAEPESPAPEIVRAVESALRCLTAEERELVIRFHYMGQTLRVISKLSGRRVHKLEAMHKRVVRKLRRLLADFVRRRYGIDSRQRDDCPLCQSDSRVAIDRLIRTRDRSATWRPVMATLRRHYGLRVWSPQVLIGHERYHMPIPEHD